MFQIFLFFNFIFDFSIIALHGEVNLYAVVAGVNQHSTRGQKSSLLADRLDVH